jgi:DNA-binding transcriptional MerR regulator
VTITAAGSLSIAEAAELVGVSTHTLRYYEREGLMRDPVARSSSTHRRYDEADIGWLRFITRLRATAMPIARIKQYTVLARQGDDTTEARLELLRAHRVEVMAQLAEVNRSLEAIDAKIGFYEGKL